VPYAQQRTLRQLLLSVRRLLGDILEGTTTAIGTTTALRDSANLRGAVNDWASSEGYLFDDLVGRPVTAFDGIDKITFAPPASGIVGSGVPYLLGHLEGSGFFHADIIDAIQNAVIDAGGYTEAAPDTTLVTALNTYEYTIPATLATLFRVEVVRTTGLNLNPWVGVAKDRDEGWSVVPGTRRLRLAAAAGLAWGGYTLRLHGRTRDAVPTLLADVVNADGGWVRDAAALHLALQRQDEPKYARLAATLFARVERRRPAVEYWYPDEVALPLADAAAVPPPTYTATRAWDPPALAIGAAASTTVAVAGATVGDTVFVSFSLAVPGGALLVGNVTSAGVVTCTLLNQTGGVLDLGSGTLRVDVVHH
jgi:hypothetical protein